MTHIEDNLISVRDSITQSISTSGRNPHDVQLIAVSKTHPADAIKDAIEAGQTVFGENRVQEALQKWPALKAQYSGIELHLIGALQTNKIKEALSIFDVIETVDREKLARALAKEMNKIGKYPQCYIQVNTGKEPQKAGIPPEEASNFIALCRDELKLPIVGLMCIPPAEENPTPHFEMLKNIAAQHDLTNLSMGMSGDFEEAIHAGATHIRVGTAIFGKRDYAK